MDALVIALVIADVLWIIVRPFSFGH